MLNSSTTCRDREGNALVGPSICHDVKVHLGDGGLHDHLVPCCPLGIASSEDCTKNLNRKEILLVLDDERADNIQSPLQLNG